VANTNLTTSIIAKAAVAILDNELVAGNQVFRGFEDEFDNTTNGYTVGDTISVRKPTQFTVRDGATASIQDVTEGKTTITVDKQKGIDFAFTSKELTLNIRELADRVLKPAMVQLANQVDSDVLALDKDVYNWVGAPGTDMGAFSTVAAAAKRLDQTAVPMDGRVGIVSPADHWGVASAQTALYMQDVAKGAYRKGSIGDVAGVDLFRSQNVRTHTFGQRGGTPLVNGASQNVAYSATLNTGSVPGTQSLITDGWTAAAANRVKQGDVFTIAGVFAVNPVTKATLPFLQQFVATADVSSDGSGNATLTIAPAIITSGAFQTVSAVPADNAALTFLGTASAGVSSNLIYKKEAFALVSVPLVKPPGAVDCSRQSYKGLSVRLIPYYNGSTDVSSYRMDILYGVKTVDPRLATRVAG
jgi:hypothetical protein